MSRPSKYNEKITPQFAEYVARQLETPTAEDIAEAMGISVSTFYEWQKKYPEFSEAVARGRDEVDAQVENALLKICLGYEWEEVTLEKYKTGSGEERSKIKKVTKHYSPNEAAIRNWLSNRKPDKWRNKQDESKVNEEDIERINDISRDLSV